MKEAVMHLTDSDLASRRRASARFAWVLGGVAVGLYVVGFFIQR
jgi:predicted nucleic acid-binding Zn ribbon protein